LCEVVDIALGNCNLLHIAPPLSCTISIPIYFLIHMPTHVLLIETTSFWNA
jgi:hypothetical protein